MLLLLLLGRGYDSSINRYRALSLIEGGRRGREAL